MKHIRFSIFLIFCLCFIACSKQQDVPWTPLFDGHSLNGWELRNGTASYKVKDAEIIGTTTFGSPNTFLCTTAVFSDFILEFEVMVDSTINSGVQIRSNSNLTYNKGLVHGYQVEIDPSERAWSGGIYDEGRRGWLYNLEDNEKGRLAFKNGAFNHYRVEAIGNHLKVWVNGIPTANLKDDMTNSGFIGLQVHSIQDSTNIGKEIRWKNINIITEKPDLYTLKNIESIDLKEIKN